MFTWTEAEQLMARIRSNAPLTPSSSRKLQQLWFKREPSLVCICTYILRGCKDACARWPCVAVEQEAVGGSKHLTESSVGKAASSRGCLQPQTTLCTLWPPRWERFLHSWTSALTFNQFFPFFLCATILIKHIHNCALQTSGWGQETIWKVSIWPT